MIQQVFTYGKFLKNLCIKKKTINFLKKIFLTISVSSYLSSHMPVKYKDPRSPTISCVIREIIIDRALLDLGASVNILWYSIYKKLGTEELKPLEIILQLVDRSVRVPKRVMEDVLIKVGNFIYLMNFVILETEPVSNPKGHILVILGRPFLATTNILINYHNGLMKLSFGNMTIDLNIFNLENKRDQFIDVNLIQDEIYKTIDLGEEDFDCNL